MKKVTLILIALSTHMLVACEDESITINGRPINDEPVVPTEPVSLDALLLNDVSGNTYLNSWECDDPAYPGEVTEMVFFADGSALIGTPDDLDVISYTVTDSVVELFLEGAYIAQYSNFNVAASEQSYELSYSVVDGTTGTLSCQLTGDVPTTQQTFDAGAFVNFQDENDIDNVWACFLSNGTQMIFGLGANGLGAFGNDIDSDYIALTWSADAQGLYLSLFDGTQVIASNPTLEGGNLVADSVSIDGTNAGSMQCQRLTA